MPVDGEVYDKAASLRRPDKNKNSFAEHACVLLKISTKCTRVGNNQGMEELILLEHAEKE